MKIESVETLLQAKQKVQNLKSRIVTEAREWIGTRFKHQARLKLIGCDCLGLVIGIASNLEILSKDNFPLSNLAPSNYPKIPDGSMLEAKLNQHLYQININQISPGDLLLFNIDNNPRHLAIVSDYKNELGIIHSLAVLRSVVEHRLDEDWKGRICKAYGFSG